jgi:hypothetical protein
VDRDSGGPQPTRPSWIRSRNELPPMLIEHAPPREDDDNNDLPPAA